MTDLNVFSSDCAKLEFASASPTARIAKGRDVALVKDEIPMFMNRVLYVKVIRWRAPAEVGEA